MVEAKGYLPYSVNVNVEDKHEYYEREINVNLQLMEEGAIAELSNIFYEFNSWKLSKESFGELDRFFSVLADNPAFMIEIAGHTDSVGDKDVNFQMAQGRAQSVVNYFTRKGISSDRIVAQGYGELYPIDSNDSAEGRAENRRTELIIHSSDEDESWRYGYYYEKEHSKEKRK
jgi:outer membrane protein OmpA-like peptidoglycan-associated protein